MPTMGGDLGGDWGDGPRHLRWGTAHASVPKNFEKYSVIACVARCHEGQRRQSGLKSGGSWTRVKKFRFSIKISEKFRFFQAISQTKKSIFHGKFPESFGFFPVLSQKISIFEVKFPKNFDFLRNFPKYFNFLGKFPKNFDFFRQFHKKIDFSGQISDKFRVLRQFHKKFRFFSQKLAIYSYF